MKYLYYLILLINVIILFKKDYIYDQDKRKKLKIVHIVSLLFCISLYFLNTTSSDYIAYNNMYNGIIEENYSMDIGFTILFKIGNMLHLPFNIFQGIVCTISLLILLYVFNKFSNNYSLFFSLYYMYQLFVDLCVLRNFIARVIFALAILMIFENKKFKYVLLIIISTLVHKSMIFYLPLIFFFNIDENKSKLYLTIMSSLILLFCFYVKLNGNGFDFIISIASTIFPNEIDRIRLYLTTTTNNGYLIYFGLHMINLFIILVVGHIIEQRKLNFKNYNYFLFINLYVLLSFPLIIINTDFHRLFQNIFIINFIFYAQLLELFKNDNKMYYSFLTSVLCLTTLYTLPFVHASNQRMLILNGILK